jgi:putative flippase GtrA
MTFVRYVAIQVIAYAIDMGMFLLLLKTELAGTIVSNVFAKLVAGIFAFVLHRNFTFRAENNQTIRHQAIRYFLLLSLNVPFASALLAVVLLIITEPVIAKLIADVVSVALTYALSKHFIFSGKQKDINKNTAAGGHF